MERVGFKTYVTTDLSGEQRQKSGVKGRNSGLLTVDIAYEIRKDRS